MKFSFLLPNVEISGGNRANFELANALVAQGHEVQIFYPQIPGRDGLGWTNLRKTLVQIVKGTRNFTSRQSWFELDAELTPLPFFSKRQLQRRLPEADYLIVSWWAHVSVIADLDSTFGKQVHLIRSMEFWGGPKEKVTQAYQQTLLKLVTSPTLKKQYELEFGEVDGIVPDGVCLNTFSVGPNGSADRHASQEVVAIGMMYRRQPLKRMADGLKVLANVSARHPNVRIMLFGEAVKRKDKLMVNSIPRIEYLRFPTGNRLRDLYRSLDIFLFTSGPEEAFGLPPLEAMACGCAVVSTDVGAIREYATNGVSALICQVGDTAALEKQIEKLILDVGLRKSLRENAATAALSFSWQQSASRLEEILLSR